MGVLRLRGFKEGFIGFGVVAFLEVQEPRIVSMITYCKPMPDQGVFRALQSVDFLSCQGFENLQPGLFQNYAHMFHTGARAPAKVA